MNLKPFSARPFVFVRSFVALSLLSLLALAATACTPKPDGNTVKIGLAGPLSGSEAKFGEQLLKGAQMAVDDLNAQGGLKGKKVELVTGDDACEPKQARAVANRLASEGLYGVIGHFCSGSTLPASEVYAERNLLMITPGSTNPQVTERGLATILRACGRDDQQGPVAADFIATRLKPKAVAVIHDMDAYGQGLADAMRARLHGQYKIQEVLYESLSRGDKDFSALVTKMKGLRVDVIYYGGVSTEAGLLIRQAREAGLAAKFVSGDGIVTESFPEVAGGAVDGVYMTFGPDPRQTPGAKAVVAKFRAQGYEPEAYTLYSYASAQIMLSAIASTGTYDGKALADYIKAHPTPTVMGEKSFDAKGDPAGANYVMYQWGKKDGKWVYQQVK